jgi:hypothetical protein
MKQKPVSINHPLWDKLRELDKTADMRFSKDFDKGFGPLGLRLTSSPENGGYHCTPTNSLAFACTGGDGIHFSFLVQKGQVTEKSPIVITIPPDGSNAIVGETLFDFLCLGYHRGYFGVGTLPSEWGLAAYGSANWQPTEEWQYAIGLGVDEHQRKLLDFLIAELDLSPWRKLKQRFERLQAKYMPLLEMPEGDARFG